MPGKPIPDEIRDFIIRHIYTVAHMEALLLLVGGENEWPVEDCAKRLYISPWECEAVLKSLAADGLLEITDEGRFRFSKMSAYGEHVLCVTEFYRKHIIPVTNLIHSKSRRLHEFANAFKLRRDS